MNLSTNKSPKTHIELNILCLPHNFQAPRKNTSCFQHEVHQTRTDMFFPGLIGKPQHTSNLFMPTPRWANQSLSACFYYNINDINNTIYHSGPPSC